MHTRSTSSSWLIVALLSLAAGCANSEPARDSDDSGRGDGDGNDDSDDGDGEGGDGEQGDGDADSAGDGDASGAHLLPWAEGNTWTYAVSGSAGTSKKVITVGPLEQVGGTGPNKDKMAFRITTKKGDSDETVSWQAVEGDRVLRYREQSFSASTGELALEEHWDPYKIHIDGSAARRVAGAEWVESYEETKIVAGMPETSATVMDHWLVDGVDQSVTVPAGTFRAIVFRKAGGSSTKTYWYVPGVGKVKETGGQTEVLESFDVQSE